MKMANTLNIVDSLVGCPTRLRLPAVVAVVHGREGMNSLFFSLTKMKHSSEYKTTIGSKGCGLTSLYFITAIDYYNTIDYMMFRLFGISYGASVHEEQY